jgi:outer membrane receptor protein involved in Fe transport
MLVGGGLLATDGSFPFTDTNGIDRIRDHNAALAFEGLARVAARIGGVHRVDLLAEGAWDRREIGGLEQYPSTTAQQRTTRAVVRASWDGPPAFGSAGWSRASAFYRRLGFAYQDDAPPSGPPTATTLISHGFGADAATEGILRPWLALSGGLSATHDRGESHRLGGASGSPSRTTVSGRVGARFGPFRDRFGATVDLRVEWDPGFGVRPIPAVGAWLDPWGPIRVFANVSRGFRLPTLEELHFDAGFVQGNPDLDPEDALTWDAGIELGRDRPWGLSATYFENRVRNLILFLPRSAFLVRAENSGDATIRGVEVAGRLAWRWFDVQVAYTFMDARFGATGRRMPQRPAHQIHGEIAATMGPVTLSVMPGWRAAVHLDRFESLSEEARFELDARLDWAFSRLLSLSVDARNLTDKRDAVDHLQRPLPGRSFFLTMRFRR